MGELLQGGIVFYSGATVLIAALKDIELSLCWGCYKTAVSGTSTAVGTGSANTTKIISVCTGYTMIAANVCSNYSYSGYSDWFLPSKDELILMNTNLGSQGLGNFASASYYSSSESSSTGAWGYAFGYGYVSGPGKSGYPYYVRAVRAF